MNSPAFGVRARVRAAVDEELVEAEAVRHLRGPGPLSPSSSP
jgi:hypothetical protein